MINTVSPGEKSAALLTVTLSAPSTDNTLVYLLITPPGTVESALPGNETARKKRQKEI